jgi:hypothetical protein
MKNPMRKHLVLLAAFAGLATIATGCGKQAFTVTASQQEQQAPGSFNIAPKVDILLVEDDMGSIREIFSNVSSQMNQFLSDLQTRGWDYHLATIPLTTYRQFQQVQASQYDPNWGAQWMAPYPGAQASQLETVNASAFRQPNQYTDFLNGDDTSNAKNGNEPGLANLKQMLQDSSIVTSGFLRHDALLAIVIVGTGEDTSNRNICSYNGSYWPCDLVPTNNDSIVCGQPGANPSPNCNNEAASFAPYQTFLQGYKGNLQQIRMYSMVSKYRWTGGGCMGANTFAGTRYQKMASALGGLNFDICSVPITTALDSIASNLNTVKLNFRQHYLFMDQQPEPSSIVVWRNPGGDKSKRVQIPQSSSNGWSFAGNVTNVYAIDYPAQMNLSSGWAVMLNGSYEITGSDTGTVEFTPYGATNSAAK